MHEIPKPEVLDPDRPLRQRGTRMTEDDRPETGLLSGALHESCEYAEQLWDDLNGVRQYLLDSLPPDPRVPGAPAATSASPTGPDDEAGWDNWIKVFASVSSVLCGPRGDSGFGLGQAREHAQIRRAAPAPQAAQHDEPSAEQSAPERTEPAQHPQAGRKRSRKEMLRNAATIGLAVLAVRGLRAPRRDRDPGR